MRKYLMEPCKSLLQPLSGFDEHRWIAHQQSKHQRGHALLLLLLLVRDWLCRLLWLTVLNTAGRHLLLLLLLLLLFLLSLSLLLLLLLLLGGVSHWLLWWLRLSFLPGSTSRALLLSCFA
jgi:hypothetical protein